LWSNSQKWDTSILGVIDSASYSDEVRDSLEENTSSEWTSGAVPENLEGDQSSEGAPSSESKFVTLKPK